MAKYVLYIGEGGFQMAEMGMSISGAGIARDNQTNQSYWTAPGADYVSEPFAPTSMATTPDGNVKITFQRTETVTVEASADQIADIFPKGFNFGQAYANAQEGGASSYSYAKASPPQTTRDYPTNNQPIPQRARLGDGGSSESWGNSTSLVPASPKFYGHAGGIVDVKIA